MLRTSGLVVRWDRQQDTELSSVLLWARKESSGGGLTLSRVKEQEMEKRGHQGVGGGKAPRGLGNRQELRADAAAPAAAPPTSAQPLRRCRRRPRRRAYMHGSRAGEVARLGGRGLGALGGGRGVALVRRGVGLLHLLLGSREAPVQVLQPRVEQQR